TIATVTYQNCKINSVNVRANGATTADLTDIGVYGGAGKVITFINTTTGVRANLDAADKQVGGAPDSGIILNVGKTIVMTLTGTGATAVDFTVTIEYEALADGGYLS
ncbi:MAG: hypothetical protein PHF31_14260, partial [Methylobacter sp.]|nr:hypothetical protein [Methylobacter sp.]